MEKEIDRISGYAFCPDCSHLLIWGDAIGIDTQDCRCLCCGKKYIAKFKEKRNKNVRSKMS